MMTVERNFSPLAAPFQSSVEDERVRGLAPRERISDGCSRVLPVMYDDTKSSNDVYYEASDRNSVAEVDMDDIVDRLEKSENTTRKRRSRRRGH